MDLNYIYRRTALGHDALSDPDYPMSAGFKRLLGCFDGDQPTRNFRRRMPHLDENDLREWTAELIRNGMIESIDITMPPANLPSPWSDNEPSVVRTQQLYAWAMSNTQALSVLGALDSKALERTSHMATLEAQSMAAPLARDGVVLSLVTTAPQPIVGSATGTGGASHAGMAQLAGRPRTVLVIEHQAALLQFWQKLLDREGHVTRTAQNRAEIITRLNHRESLDLIVLNVGLPDTDGFHVLERIRANPRFTRVPVLIVTRAEAQDDIAKGVLLGATGYITTPLRPAELLAAVRASLGVEGPLTPVPSPPSAQ